MKKIAIIAAIISGFFSSCISPDPSSKAKELSEFRGEVEVLDTHTMQSRRIPVILQIHRQNLIAIDLGVWLRIFPRRDPSGYVQFEQEIERFKADGSLSTYSSPGFRVKRPTLEFRYKYSLANSAYADEAKPMIIRKPNQALEPTPTAVTPRADARVAPAAGVAHL